MSAKYLTSSVNAWLKLMQIAIIQFQPFYFSQIILLELLPAFSPQSFKAKVLDRCKSHRGYISLQSYSISGKIFSWPDMSITIVICGFFGFFLCKLYLFWWLNILRFVLQNLLKGIVFPFAIAYLDKFSKNNLLFVLL